MEIKSIKNEHISDYIDRCLKILYASEEREADLCFNTIRFKANRQSRHEDILTIWVLKRQVYNLERKRIYSITKHLLNNGTI